MQSILTEIQEHLQNPAIHFVFPSEIVATFWRRKSLDSSRIRALRSDRFLSWDTFKERVFSLVHSEQPSNQLFRILFADMALRENVGSGSLKQLVFPEHAEDVSRYVSYVAGLLPALGSLWPDEACGDIFLSEGLREDLVFLWNKYREYLQNHGLFEPAYETADTAILDTTYILFFPEVISDFSHFAPLLAQNQIRRITLESKKTGNMVLFATLDQELDWVTKRISELLDQGVGTDRIAITAPQQEEIQLELAEKARLHDIPLIFRHGRPLSLYPQARFFALLHELAFEGFCTDTLRELAYDRRFPWRNAEGLKKLAQFGVDHFRLRNYRVNGAAKNLWREKLLLFADKELQQLYGALKETVRRVVEASSFRELLNGVLLVVNSLLDMGDLPAQEERIFLAILSVLIDLVEVEERFLLDKGYAPYQLWLTCLAQKLYVPAGGGAAVPVYPYRVSAGIYPEYHFVVATSQKNTSVVTHGYRALPDRFLSQKLLNDHDHTNEFLKLYEQSGNSVLFSCGQQTHFGPQSAPEYFVSAGGVLSEQENPKVRDFYKEELNFWSGFPDKPNKMYQAQLEGFDKMDKLMVSKTTSPASLSNNDLINHLVLLQSDESGYPSISQTDLDRWIDCPYSYLVSSVLKVAEQDYRVRLTDNALIGIFQHRMLSQLDGAAAPLSQLDDILSYELEEWRKRMPSFLPPVWRAVVATIRQQFIAFSLADAETYPDARPAAIEKHLHKIFESHAFVAHGRIDSIRKTPGGYIIVDYKKKLRLRRSELSADPTTTKSYQIPFYTMLVEDSYGEVAGAAYFDLQEGKYVHIFSENFQSWFDGDSFSDVVDAVKRVGGQMAKSIRDGVYKTPTPRGSCAGCYLRQVCREKYVLDL